MPLWPLPTQPTRQDYQRGSTGGAVAAVNVPTGGTAHTMGAWTELHASTGIDAAALALYGGGHNSSGAASPALLDIGVGAAGSEQLLLPSLDVGFHSAGRLPLVVPVTIPAGSRIAARAQGLRTATNIAVAVDLTGEQTAAGDGAPGARWTAYGADAANSRGTSVTCGNSNAWGSWTSLGTTSDDHDWWFAMMDMGADTGVTSINYRFQLAVAPSTAAATSIAGTEALFDIYWGTNSAEYIFPNGAVTPVYAPAPAGSNVYVRGTAAGTARTTYFIAYGGS